MRADLVLLDADPLADIRNTTRIAGVAIGGRWLERAQLQQMIERAGRSVTGPAGPDAAGPRRRPGAPNAGPPAVSTPPRPTRRRG